MDSPSDVPPLGKFLASSDKRTRDKAIKNLAVFLSNGANEPLPEPELKKLWKALFYCYWMSDKPLVQQDLSSELAELLLIIPSTAASIPFLRAFWEATVREWNGIDRLRLDKYYMLIRKFTNAAFRLLIREEWPSGICAEYNSILCAKGGPLCTDDSRVPSSLAYHLADIYLEELDKAVRATATKCSPVPLSVILSPFLTLAARTTSKVTYSRLQTSLFDPLYSTLSEAASPTRSSNSDSEEPQRNRSRTAESKFQHLIHNARSGLDDTKPRPPQQLRDLLLKDIFEAASKEETRDANRRKMYAVWKAGMLDGREISRDAS